MLSMHLKSNENVFGDCFLSLVGGWRHDPIASTRSESRRESKIPERKRKGRGEEGA